MISTSTRAVDRPRQADGGLLDPDPRRRSARLARGGVAIKRHGPLTHVVSFPDGETRRYRTANGAALAAHSFLDAGGRQAGPR